MRNYFLSRLAEEDIDEITSYIANDNKQAALTFLESLYSSMDLLSENPMMGHKREDLTNRPIRFFTFRWRYLIVYKYSSPIEIVRVLSGYRDITSLIS